MKRWFCLLSASLVVLGCASVRVVKVPDPNTYALEDGCDGTKDDTSPCWNEVVERANQLQGARYYLPRPFVAVKKEFPVSGGSIFVEGTVDEKNRVLQIDREKLPPALDGVFSKGTVGMSKVRLPEEEAPAAPAVGQSSSSGGAATAAPASPPAPTLQSDTKNSLKDSTVSHPDVPSAATVLTLKVKVAKDALAGDTFGQGAVLDTKKVYLVPIVQGKHGTTGLVAVDKIVSVQGKEGEDRFIEAQVDGAKVPAHASLGVGVEGTVDGARKSFVLHRQTADVHNSFAGEAPKPPASGEPAKPAEKKVSKAEATVSGDPTTDPLIKISDLYDVLLLPDFSEQYAIQVRSGVFQASADIGLENGWMAEKLNFDIDNSALGEFLIESATKLVDAGIGKVFPMKAAVDAAQAQPSGAAVAQSKKQGDPVLLRIDWVEIAVPGLYPVMKPHEQKCGFENGKPKGIAPCPPRVDYQTRVEWAVTLVTASQGTAASPASCDDEKRKEVATGLETYASAQAVKDLFKDGTVTFSNPQITPGDGLTLEVSRANLNDPTSVTDPSKRKEFEAAILLAVNASLEKAGCRKLLKVAVNSIP